MQYIVQCKLVDLYKKIAKKKKSHTYAYEIIYLNV